ncbi:hypothetical protein [Nonomuraea wenchangensis]|uniref:hypothetical protein n=1 Tax=Nonomuraea wenchangensis TaxID=568860 RepID=UPI0015A616FF|nr:hypothetical protein [Nonomuraea wenchangensis]
MTAAGGAVLSAVVSALINLLTASWSWWVFAAAAVLLAAWAAVAYAGEKDQRG